MTPPYGVIALCLAVALLLPIAALIMHSINVSRVNRRRTPKES